MKRTRLVGGTTAMAVAVAALSLPAWISSSPPSGATGGGTATVLMGTAPTSLDPQIGYSSQAAQADWITYTPLLTYAHKDGAAGSQVIPGLATGLPVISNGGKTYTMTLRSGLKFSNGTPVKASDFAYAIERALKLDWGGDSFYTSYIEGASAYLKGTASTISGITSNDTTGKITVNLVTVYGAFDNVLAFPSSAPVPSTTPMKNMNDDPPPGVGAYVITNVVPDQSFTLKKNPLFAGFHIPNIPTGYLSQINVKITSNPTAEAEEVLDNQATSFNPGDVLPPSLVKQVEAQKSRFEARTGGITDYFFLNTQRAPFNNQLAREAVITGIDRDALVRLSGGFGTPGCYLLPPGIVGHPTAPCPYGNANGPGNLAKAKALLKKSGEMGATVTAWSEETAPYCTFAQYYASMLNKIGFKATFKCISDAIYIATIGSATTNPQTGFAAWGQDFPNPSDFYLLMDAKTIMPVNNRNLSNVNDPKIQAALATLDAVPSSKLASANSQWQKLDEYVAKKAYMVVYEYAAFPEFLSNRISFKKAVFSSQYLNDWSTWQLDK